MAQPGFIFGGNTGMSYDQIQKQRDIANELLRANMSTPQNVGEGLSAIGRALAAKAIDKRTSRADDANRAASEERRASAIGSIFGGGGSASPAPYASAAPVTGPTPITFTPETPNPAGLDPSIIGAVDRVAPNAPQAMDAGAIGPRLVADLVRDFNLTPEQAAGVAGNLAHETGGFKHMQEIQPMIPGSRGGFGFAQWTGPRRKAFEAWTAQNGLDPNSYEANYGFLAHELKNTPEGAVLGPLSQAQTPDQAATVFSDQFLRPGIPNNGSRVAFAQQFAQGGQGAPAAPAAPTGGVDPANIKLIADLLADPYTPPGEKVMLEQAMAMALQGMDPMRQMEMERARLELDQMRNPQPGFRNMTDEEEVAAGLDPSGVYQQGQDGSINTIQAPVKPAEVSQLEKQYERAKSEGYQGDFVQYQLELKKAGASNTTVENNIPGQTPAPSDEALRKKLMEGEGTAWSDHLKSGATASGMRQDMELLDQVIELAPSGPISGRLAEMFPGVSDAAGVFQSVVKRVAPSLRVEGSGSQSDIEYNGFLQSLPALQNRPEANRAIASFLKSKAQINMDRAAAVAAYQNGEISAVDARKRIAEIDSRSIMTPEMEALVNNLDQGGEPDPATGEGIPTWNAEKGVWE